jgi:hypothetical protein
LGGALRCLADSESLSPKKKTCKDLILDVLKLSEMNQDINPVNVRVSLLGGSSAKVETHGKS